MFVSSLKALKSKVSNRLLLAIRTKAAKPRSFSREPDLGQTVLIHVGKSGGASLRAALQSSVIADTLFPVHIRQPPIREDLKYIIVTRNPLTRAISAFNFRQKLMITDRKERERFPGEVEIFQRYMSIDTLGNALYDNEGVPNLAAHDAARTIHHIREDISFYLTELLERCDPNQVLAVLMQENLDNDILRVFGIQNRHRVHDNTSMRNDWTISDRARRNLMRFLHRDYEALARLYAWGKIEHAVYRKALLDLGGD